MKFYALAFAAAALASQHTTLPLSDADYLTDTDLFATETGVIALSEFTKLASEPAVTSSADSSDEVSFSDSFDTSLGNSVIELASACESSSVSYPNVTNFTGPFSGSGSRATSVLSSLGLLFAFGLATL